MSKGNFEQGFPTFSKHGREDEDHVLCLPSPLEVYLEREAEKDAIKVVPLSPASREMIKSTKMLLPSLIPRAGRGMVPGESFGGRTLLV